MQETNSPDAPALLEALHSPWFGDRHSADTDAAGQFRLVCTMMMAMNHEADTHRSGECVDFRHTPALEGARCLMRNEDVGLTALQGPVILGKCRRPVPQREAALPSVIFRKRGQISLTAQVLWRNTIIRMPDRNAVHSPQPREQNAVQPRHAKP